MAEAPVICLDRSKPFSEVRGERTPEDPYYRVHFMQGRKVGSKTVLLPFDVNGNLVPDDGATNTSKGLNSEGKETIFHPLYNADMRALMERLQKRAAEHQADAEQPEDQDEIVGASNDPLDDINLEAWLRGQARYKPHLIRAAAKKRFHVMYADEADLVRGLVLDEKLVPEDQVCAALKRYITQ